MEIAIIVLFIFICLWLWSSLSTNKEELAKERRLLRHAQEEISKLRADIKKLTDPQQASKGVPRPPQASTSKAQKWKR